MNRRLREMVCALLGHEWVYWEFRDGWVTKSKDGRGTHKYCERCNRQELNL